MKPYEDRSHTKRTEQATGMNIEDILNEEDDLSDEDNAHSEDEELKTFYLQAGIKPGQSSA